MAAALAPVLVAGTACGAGTTSAAGRLTSADRASAPPAPASSAAPNDLNRRLRELENSSHRHIGAFALDTGTGRAVGYRTHERFPSLSTFKAVEAAAILDKARRSDPGLLDRVIHWTADEEVEGSSINGHGAEGMTVARLCEAAVTVSDNTAGNLLLKQIGGPAGLTRYYRSLHDPISRLDRTEPTLNDWRPGEKHDTTTPASMGRNLSRLTLSNALTLPDRAQLNAWLRATSTGKERIRAGLPKDWTVGDKTGTNSAFAGANDIAIAQPPSGAPLIISIYTYGKAGDPIDNKTIATTATLLTQALTRTP